MMTGVSIIGAFRKKQFLEKTEVEPETLLNDLLSEIRGKKKKEQQNKVNVIEIDKNKEEIDDKMKEHKDNVYSHKILPKNFKYKLPKQQEIQKKIKKNKWLNI